VLGGTFRDALSWFGSTTFTALIGTKMATANTSDDDAKSGETTPKRPRRKVTKPASQPRRQPARRQASGLPNIPTWLGVVASLIGAGLVAGYYASQNSRSNDEDDVWDETHSSAFARGETDPDNFDQTRLAGKESMRDDHDDWEDIDDLSDASFPASDPPSFNPGIA
jgi:hypothetical protein